MNLRTSVRSIQTQISNCHGLRCLLLVSPARVRSKADNGVPNMKIHCYWLLILSLSGAAFGADAPPPVYQKEQTTAVQPAPQAAATATATPAVTPAPPPAGPPKRSAADLEKLVAPIALYPDPLIATMLPASVYPLEIVQAARFVANTNNLSKLDEQSWDENVKEVARVPDAIKKLNEDISWTIELGDAFLAQDKDVMDAIQSMRSKARNAGTLQTTPQQIVVVTNMVVEKTVEQQVVVVTNTVVQIQPASSTVVYVPTYNPYTVYYPPPAYVYNPMAPVVTFAAGVAMGAIIANNCNWYHGGCYHGNVNINVNNNYNYNQKNNYNYNQNNNFNQNNNNNFNKNGNNAQAKTTSAQQKWQPDQSRLSKSGSPTATSSARSAEARGWSSGGAGPSTGSVGARPSTGTAGARPSTGAVGAGPSAGNAAARPSTGTPSASRPTASPNASRPSSTPNYSQPKASSAASRPSSSGSAFGGASSGARTSDFSSRGASSRGSSGGGGRSGGGGGGRR